MRRLLGFLLTCSLPLTAACGSSPTAPTVNPSSAAASESSPSTATSITLTSPRSIYSIGASETLTATATMADRSTREVSHGAWRSDNPSVATVNAGGLVTAVAFGDASIIVEFGGAQAAAHIAVRPDYQGRFDGKYLITSCVSTEEFESYKVCDAMFPPNSGVAYDVTLALTQSGSDLSGIAFFDQLQSPLAAATIARDGSVRTTSSLVWSNAPISITWNLKQTQSGRVDGTLVMVWTHAVHTGSMTVTGEFRDVLLTSPTARVGSSSRQGWNNLAEVWRR